MKKKYKKNCLIIGFIILFVSIFICFLIFLDTLNYKTLNFYKDNCPKLNSLYLENYTMCYHVIDSEIIYYNIDKYKGKLYLIKNTQFFGIDKK